MSALRTVSTAIALAGVGICAAVVVSASSADHHRVADKDITPTPSSPPSSVAPSTSAPTIAPTPTKASHRPSATRHAASSHPADRTTSAASPRTSQRVAAPRTTAARPAPAASPTAQPVRGQALPLGFSTGTATQVITVVAPSYGSTTATLRAWTKAPGGGWLAHSGSLQAHIGSQGMTTSPSESKSATPIGSFTLTQAFGRASNPGTALPYFQTDSADWWVSDANSQYYNTHYRCSSNCPFNTGAGENLYAAGYVYTYAVVIDYNRWPAVKGAGSAFFLHVTNGAATAGCVAIDESSLVSIMDWLNPSAHPRILIGVG